MAHGLVRQLLMLGPGDHVCQIYETTAERLAAAIPFVQHGLARGDRCLYVSDDSTALDFVQNLAGAGLDAAGLQVRGMLRLLSDRDSYRRGGEFTPQTMIDFLRGEESRAMAEGCSGLRIVGEMTWALGPEVDCERLIEYEALLNKFLTASRAAALCQYDRTRFDPAVMEKVLRTPPAVILGEQVWPNPFYETPQMVLGQVSAAERADWKIDQLKQVCSAKQIARQHNALLQALMEGLIAESKQLEAERDALLQRLRLQIERLPLAYVLLDQHFEVVDWNPAAEQTFGYSKAEATGRPGFDLINALPPGNGLEELIRGIEAGELPSQRIAENQTREGRTILCEWYNTPLMDVDGKFSGIIVLALDITERRRRDEAQRQHAAHLQQLSRRVIEVQERERRHLARELHDEIGQVLSSLSANLHLILEGCDATVRPCVDDSLAIVNQAIQQVHSLSLDLRPLMLDDLGLISTLRSFADRQAQRAGFALHFAAKPIGRRLPADIETAGYRVVQEALTNVVRHARAKRVWLHVEEREEEVQLEIRDDGAGFDVSRARERAVQGASLGVLGMQERVELLGGTFAILSRPGHGTTIRARLPIELPHKSTSP